MEEWSVELIVAVIGFLSCRHLDRCVFDAEQLDISCDDMQCPG